MTSTTTINTTCIIIIILLTNFHIFLIFCIHFLDLLFEVIWLIIIVTIHILAIVIITLFRRAIAKNLSAIIKRVIIVLFIILDFDIFNLTLKLRLIICSNGLWLGRACTYLSILFLLHFFKQTNNARHKKSSSLQYAIVFLIHQHFLDIKLPHHAIMFCE